MSIVTQGDHEGENHPMNESQKVWNGISEGDEKASAVNGGENYHQKA